MSREDEEEVWTEIESIIDGFVGRDFIEIRPMSTIENIGIGIRRGPISSIQFDERGGRFIVECEWCAEAGLPLGIRKDSLNLPWETSSIYSFSILMSGSVPFINREESFVSIWYLMNDGIIYDRTYFILLEGENLSREVLENVTVD